jgi:hypothetical protein
MIFDQDVGKGRAVRRMEQLGRACEVDQDVGLRRTAPAISAFLGHGLVERRHPTSGLLEPRAQGFECRAILRLEGYEPLQTLRRECRAGIFGGFLHQIVNRIADFLGRVDRAEDGI